MSSHNLTLGTTDIFVGALILLVCVPLYLGRVKPNHYYGFRFRESYASDEAWYAVNRYGARLMMAWSVALIAFGVVLLFVPFAPGSPMFWAAQGAPLMMLVPGLQAWRYGRRVVAGEEREVEPERHP